MELLDCCCENAIAVKENTFNVSINNGSGNRESSSWNCCDSVDEKVNEPISTHRHTHFNLSDNNLLLFADRVNEMIYQLRDVKMSEETLNIQIPQLVVIGAQSSGKSTVLNRIISFDILPTGSSMVTRSPTNIRLHYSDDDEKIIISTLNNGNSTIEFSTSINHNDYSEIHKQINKINSKITTGLNISDIPIIIDVYSSKVINISLLDLPGLVTIALEDKGQSHNIKSEIETLISKNVERPNTIALVVIQAKTDLEIDIGLSCVKEIQKKNKNITSIGVLTKPDSLNDKDLLFMNNIISERTSKSLKLDKGYFIVNNDYKIKNEEYWFKKKFPETTEVIKKNRYGIKNLRAFIQSCLIEKIRFSLPNVKNQLVDLEKKILKDPELSNSIASMNEKWSFLNIVFSTIEYDIKNAIDGRGQYNLNIGGSIRNIFDEFITETSLLEPFSKTNITDEYILKIKQQYDSFEQLHQPKFNEIIKHCFNDKTRKPIFTILPYITKTFDKIQNEFNNLIKNLINLNIDDIPNSYKRLNNFPALKDKILNGSYSVLQNLNKKAFECIKINLEVNSYIWINPMTNEIDILDNVISQNNYDLSDSDSETLQSQRSNSFRSLKHERRISSSSDTSIKINNKQESPLANSLLPLNISTPLRKNTSNKMKEQIKKTKKEPNNKMLDKNLFKYNDLSIDNIRHFLEVYFKYVLKRMQDTIIKTIVVAFIDDFKLNYSDKLRNELTCDNNDISELFFENSEILNKKRIVDTHLITIKKLINEITTI